MPYTDDDITAFVTRIGLVLERRDALDIITRLDRLTHAVALETTTHATLAPPAPTRADGMHH